MKAPMIDASPSPRAIGDTKRCRERSLANKKRNREGSGGDFIKDALQGGGGQGRATHPPKSLLGGCECKGMVEPKTVMRDWET